jgi:hypothetical protein
VNAQALIDLEQELEEHGLPQYRGGRMPRDAAPFGRAPDNATAAEPNAVKRRVAQARREAAAVFRTRRIGYVMAGEGPPAGGAGEGKLGSGA